MKHMLQRILKSIWAHNVGQDLIEYALLAGFVVVGAAGLTANFSESLNIIYQAVVNHLNRVASWTPS